MNQNTSSNTSTRRGLVAGAILTATGIFMLLANLIKLEGPLFLGLLSLAFISFGLAFRNNGLIIPGGIIAGVAAGAYLIEGPYKGIGDPMNGGIFMLSLAGGFLLVSLLSIAVYALGGTGCKFMYWPIFPAAGLVMVGGLLLANNLRLLEILGQGWPVVLIVIGLYLLLRRREMQS